jgi:hypothetical protein
MRTLVTLITITGTFFIASCTKEGCTDPNAWNYNRSAKKNDGSCQYKGEVVIWYGSYTANQLINDDAYSLTFYVDGQIVGSTSTSVYWTSAPACGDNGSITISRDLGGSTTGSFPYTVRDQTGFLYWSGTLNFEANQCKSVQLVW